MNEQKKMCSGIMGDFTNLSSFFEKIKILSSLEKARATTPQLEQDIAFLKALQPLLSDKLKTKTSEAIKMLPFFGVMPILKKTEELNHN